MPDDKSKVGEPDRSRVAADQDYEVGYLAGKYGLSAQQVRQLIAVSETTGRSLTKPCKS